MSSGLPENIQGPNDSNGKTTNFGLPGDVDLDALVTPSTYDACVIEFDFACPAASDTFTPQVTFNYVFASEEYLEFVNSSFNDAFAFFLNGQNIALVPGTSDPVTINTVNHLVNTAYFIDNTGAAENNQADGYTTLLTAVANPQAGTNTIKLAIADAGDTVLDSWVLLQAGSFSCGTASPTKNPTESPTKNPTASPTKNPTESPTKNPTASPTQSPTESPTLSWCPGDRDTDFCLAYDECVQCTTTDDEGTEIRGCVYQHAVGKEGCALQCISCGSTCGLSNANKNSGKPEPQPGCGNWQTCNNKDEYIEACD